MRNKPIKYGFYWEVGLCPERMWKITPAKYNCPDIDPMFESYQRAKFHMMDELIKDCTKEHLNQVREPPMNDDFIKYI